MNIEHLNLEQYNRYAISRASRAVAAVMGIIDKYIAPDATDCIDPEVYREIRKIILDEINSMRRDIIRRLIV